MELTWPQARVISTSFTSPLPSLSPEAGERRVKEVAAIGLGAMCESDSAKMGRISYARLRVAVRAVSTLRPSDVSATA